MKKTRIRLKNGMWLVISPTADQRVVQWFLTSKEG